MNRSQRRLAKLIHIERREEKIAPAAQRKSVVDPAGHVLRGPRVEPAGRGFIRSNPLRALWVRSQTKAARLERATIITNHHLACSERLLRAWTETADGITVTPVPIMGDHISGGDSAGGPATAVLHQIAQEDEWRGAQRFLGPELWRPILQVVLLGIPVNSWAASLQWDEKFAMGYLVCSLDRLVAYYKPRNVIA